MIGTVKVVHVRDVKTNHTRVYIGRPSTLGNPFPLRNEADRRAVVIQYRDWLREQKTNQTKVWSAVVELANRVKQGENLELACFCSPKLCHGNVIASAIASIIEDDKPIEYARYAANGYEVSSAGDKRFSALYAKLQDGRTIEEAYQLDVKGYRQVSNNWKAGKGKPPLVKMTQQELWNAYLGLWKTWASENPELINDLRSKCKGRSLTDKFASSPISQARALASILNGD